jgi:hypothetical protein
LNPQIVRKSGPTMPKEDEPKGLIAPLKEHLAAMAEAVSPTNLSKQVALLLPVLLLLLLLLLLLPLLCR